jgi:aurora kinase
MEYLSRKYISAGGESYRVLSAQGEFSTVVKAKCLVSGSTVVLKMYAKKRMHPVCLRQVEREIAIHSQLNHKNIVNLYGAFQDSEFYYLVLECAIGVSE